MSHFSVLVIGAEPGEVGEALAPWMEYSCGKPDDRYLEFFEDEDCDVDETTGKRGYWQNPNSRWDWFVPGGRYANTLPLKDGSFARCFARVGEIQFGTVPEMHQKALDFWRKAVDGDLREGETAPFCWPPADVLRREYRSAEDYASHNDKFVPWAVVKDGEWHEEDEMGWWGLSANMGTDRAAAWREGFFDSYIKDLDPKTPCTVVDCHI